jgi:hypothetical protein
MGSKAKGSPEKDSPCRHDVTSLPPSQYNFRGAPQPAGLIHAESKFPPSLTLITAVLLLLIGIAAIVSMVFQVGPFD